MRRVRRAFALPWLSAVLSFACAGAPGDGQLRGEQLGLFSVLATQRSNDCGDGALGESRELDFEVELSRLPTEIFWDGRQATTVRGSHFELTDQVVAEVRAASSAEEPGCRVVRVDRIAVTLDDELPGQVETFQGEMSYGFRAAPLTSCLPSDVSRAGVARLPCAIHYELAGRQRRNPNTDF